MAESFLGGLTVESSSLAHTAIGPSDLYPKPQAQAHWHRMTSHNFTSVRPWGVVPKRHGN